MQKKISGFVNYFRHVKKFLNFWVLANVKVAQAKFFNFGFYCKPSLFVIHVIRKIRKNILELSTNRRDTLYKCSLLSPSLSVSLLKYWIMTCFHLFDEYQTTNFFHKYYVIFVLIFSNAQNLETKILFGTIRFLFQLRNIGGKNS